MLQIILSFLAGVVTIASPCILPILPILLGVSIGQRGKYRPFFIVLGFIIAFTLAAALLSILAKSTGLNPNTVREIGIVVLAILGLFLIWAKPFELLMAKFSPAISTIGAKAGSGDKGNTGAFIVGATLGLVWTPCAGPVLASILTLIALEQNVFTAGILLLAYSFGAGIPMLIIAYGGQYISSKVRFISKYSKLFQQIFGLLIILLAVAMYFNLDIKLYSIILQYYPSFNPKL